MNKKDAQCHVKYCFFMLLFRIIDNKGTIMIFWSHFLKYYIIFLHTISVSPPVLKIENNLLKEKDAEYST